MSKNILFSLIFGLVVEAGYGAQVSDVVLYELCGRAPTVIGINRCVTNVAPHVALQDTFTNSVVAAIDFASTDIRLICHMLAAAEKAAEEGDAGKVAEWMDATRSMLELHERCEPIIGDGMFIRIRLQMEYAIARMINNRSQRAVRIRVEDIRRWLPDVQNPSYADNKHIARQNDFRTLLAVGALIECYRHDHGDLPSDLRELGTLLKGDETKTLFVRAFDGLTYVRRGDFWKMCIGGDPAIKATDDYFPVIDFYSGVMHDEMWFASSYSEKRRILVDAGQIKSEDIRFRCYLKDGVVHCGGALDD